MRSRLTRARPEQLDYKRGPAPHDHPQQLTVRVLLRFTDQARNELKRRAGNDSKKHTPVVLRHQLPQVRIRRFQHAVPSVRDSALLFAAHLDLLTEPGPEDRNHVIEGQRPFDVAFIPADLPGAFVITRGAQLSQTSPAWGPIRHRHCSIMAVGRITVAYGGP